MKISTLTYANFKSIFLQVSFLILLGNSIYGQTLKDEAAAKGKYIGTILNINYFNNSGNESQYTPIVDREFNAVVAENNHKFSFLMPNEPTNPDGSFNWNFTIDDLNKSQIDAMAAYGDANTVKRGHALIWYNQAPNWILNKTTNAPVGTGWTKQQIYDFAEQYIKVLVRYTDGVFQEWDVFNEAISDDRSVDFRRDTWYSAVGTTEQDYQDFMDFCFTTAHNADLEDGTDDIVLYYNDYNIEFFDGNPIVKMALCALWLVV